ncbi:MAG: hypothetical protein Kow0042_01360 [Calditrichia bacterium]
MKKKFHPLDGLILLIFVGVILLNQWIFERLWGIRYLSLYIQNGAQLSWVLSLVALIWGDLNQNSLLIGARPLEYIAGHFQLLGVVFNGLAPPGAGQLKEKGVITLYGIDRLTGIFLLALFGIFIFAWLLVVVPLQYFVFLIAGAPARLMMNSRVRPVARLQGGKIYIDEIDSEKELPGGWWESGIAQKPVSITAAFAGMILWLLKMVMA